MQKILITGSNGQLGLELQNKLKNNYNLILANKTTLDISKFEDVLHFIVETKPDIIINCAAFTAVDLCEQEEDKAFNINAIGPKNLAIAANHIGAKLVHISTDYVFDGNGIKDDNSKLRPYNEVDITNPQNVYGKSKLEGEKLVIENINEYFIIRTAWLYGEGKNFLKTMISLSEQTTEVKVVNDQIGSPTSTLELSNMIQKLIETDEFGLYNGTCEGYCSWYGFACEIYEQLNINTKVIPVTTADFPRPAKRPKYSVLENKQLRKTGLYQFLNWKDALKIYLNNNVKGV